LKKFNLLEQIIPTMSKQKRKKQSDDLLRNICDKATYCLCNIYSGINRDRQFIELLNYYINEYNSFKSDKSTIPNLINRIQNIIDFESSNTEFNTQMIHYVNHLSSKSVLVEQINKYHDYIESYRKNNPCDMPQLTVFIDILSKNNMVTDTINDIKELWATNRAEAPRKHRLKTVYKQTHITDEISYLLASNKKLEMEISLNTYILLLLSYLDEVKYGNNKSLYYLNDTDNSILFDSDMTMLIIKLNKLLKK